MCSMRDRSVRKGKVSTSISSGKSRKKETFSARRNAERSSRSIREKPTRDFGRRSIDSSDCHTLPFTIVYPYLLKVGFTTQLTSILKLNSQSAQSLCLLHLLKVVRELMNIVSVLAQVQHLVFYHSFSKITYDPCHFSPFFMLFRNTLRLFEVFDSEGFNKLSGNFGGFNQAGNHINCIQTNIGIQNALKVVSNNGVISQFNQERNCHKRVVIDQ